MIFNFILAKIFVYISHFRDTGGNMNLLMAIDWVKTITNNISKILGPILIIACSVGTIYAVVIGIKMIKADNKEARQENKQRLINIAITIVAVIALIAIFYALMAWLGDDGSTAIKEISSYITTAQKPVG